jgi:hypothetical protein
MAYSHEELTIWTIASLTKYFREREFGVPVIFDNQAREKDERTADNIQILFDGPDFRRSGTMNERLGVVHVKIFLNTSYVPTDIYHHLRLKAKVSEAMHQEIPLMRLSTKNYDRMIVGFLRAIPTRAVTVTTISIEEPDASLVEGTFCVDLC